MVLLAASTGVSAAQANEAWAEAVMAIAKTRSGGARWDTITTIQMESVIESDGTKGTYSLKAALAPSPRESANIQMGPTHMAYGWDGKQGWDLDPTGAVKVQTVRQEIAERRSAVYSDVIGYFRRDRLGAALHYLGKRQAGADHFDAVRISPAGGAPFELWINSKTHMIERQVAATSNPMQTQVFSDFRVVDGVTIPFAIRTVVKLDGKNTDADRSTVTAFAINVPLSDADFTPPSPRQGAQIVPTSAP